MGGAGLKLDVLTFVLFQAIGEKKMYIWVVLSNMFYVYRLPGEMMQFD